MSRKILILGGWVKADLDPTNHYPQADCLEIREALGLIPQMLSSALIHEVDSLKNRLANNYPFFSGWSKFKGEVDKDFIARITGETLYPLARYTLGIKGDQAIIQYDCGWLLCFHENEWLVTRAD